MIFSKISFTDCNDEKQNDLAIKEILPEHETLNRWTGRQIGYLILSWYPICLSFFLIYLATFVLLLFFFQFSHICKNVKKLKGVRGEGRRAILVRQCCVRYSLPHPSTLWNLSPCQNLSRDNLTWFTYFAPDRPSSPTLFSY